MFTLFVLFFIGFVLLMILNGWLGFSALSKVARERAQSASTESTADTSSSSSDSDSSSIFPPSSGPSEAEIQHQVAHHGLNPHGEALVRSGMDPTAAAIHSGSSCPGGNDPNDPNKGGGFGGT